MLTIKEIDQLRGQLEESMDIKIRARRIKFIEINPTQQSLPRMHVEVGGYYGNLEPGSPPEQVLAIFESTVFLVCTRNRGVEKGLPYFFAREDIRRVEEM